jgi:hypothetical protein
MRKAVEDDSRERTRVESHAAHGRAAELCNQGIVLNQMSWAQQHISVERMRVVQLGGFSKSSGLQHVEWALVWEMIVVVEERVVTGSEQTSRTCIWLNRCRGDKFAHTPRIFHFLGHILM